MSEAPFQRRLRLGAFPDRLRLKALDAGSMSRLRRFAVTGALALAGWTNCAWAQGAPQPRFPDALDRESLLVWLKRETDITPGRVLAVTPPAVTALVSTFPDGSDGNARVVIRAEALSPDTYGRTGALSWHVSLSADCAHRRLRMGETTGYTERNLLGERRSLRPADTVWRAPEPGTALESAWLAACDPAFRGPLNDASAITTAGSDSPLRKVQALEGPREYAAEVAPPRPAPARAVKAAPLPAKAPPPAKSRALTIAKAAPPTLKGFIPARAMIATAPKLRSAGPVMAQLGAYGSESQARAVLVGIKSKLGGHATRIETATVDGKTWRRALVTGFADSAEASRFCASLKAQACFARTK